MRDGAEGYRNLTRYPDRTLNPKPLLEGSWVVIRGVISPLIWVIIMVTLLITPLITVHEPPSIYCNLL